MKLIVGFFVVIGFLTGIYGIEEDKDSKLQRIHDIKSQIASLQQELYELLIVLVEKFEREFYRSGQKHDPISMLLFLMEQRDLQSSDLVDIFGSISVVEDVMAGRIEIDRSAAESLGRLFHVDSMLFI